MPLLSSSLLPHPPTLPPIFQIIPPPHTFSSIFSHSAFDGGTFIRPLLSPLHGYTFKLIFRACCIFAFLHLPLGALKFFPLKFVLFLLSFYVPGAVVHCLHSFVHLCMGRTPTLSHRHIILVAIFLVHSVVTTLLLSVLNPFSHSSSSHTCISPLLLRRPIIFSCIHWYLSFSSPHFILRSTSSMHSICILSFPTVPLYFTHTGIVPPLPFPQIYNMIMRCL